MRKIIKDKLLLLLLLLLNRKSRRFAKAEYLLGIFLLAGAYFVTGRFGLSLAFEPEQVTLIWPPAGIAVAALILFGRKMWPAIFIGAFAVNITQNEPFFVAFMIACGNTMAGLSAEYLIRRVVSDFHPTLYRMKGFVAFVLCGALAASVVSATIGSASLAAGGLIEWSEYVHTWVTWWIGDSVGILIVGSLLLTLSKPKEAFSFAREIPRLAEFLLSTALLVGLMSYAFVGPVTGAKGFVTFLIFPFLIYAASRFNSAVTSLWLFLITSIALLGTFEIFRVEGVPDNLESRILILQYFMGIVAVTSMALAAAISEKRSAQKKTDEVNENLAKEVKARDRFLAVLSHELRNPLAPITISLDLIAMKGVKDEDIKESIETIDRQVKHTIVLVNDLLDVSRIVNNKFEIRKENFDLNKILKEISKEFALQAKEKKHEFSSKLPEGPLDFYGDPTRIDQMIVNLLNNAAKFTPQNGKIWISVRSDKECVFIVVKDTGIGIEKEFLPQIFKPFSQADQKVTRLQSGMGIGLMLVQFIAQAHGGEAHVHSKGLNEGSEFTIKMPLTSSSAN